MAHVEPEVDWGDKSCWENVYEPSSDTFFLCDGIAALQDRIKNCSVILEVGSGSGYATAYTSRLLRSVGKISFHFATDINRACCTQTRDLCERNGVIVGPFCDCFAAHFRGPIDVIIFNPPYVDTPDDE